MSQKVQLFWCVVILIAIFLQFVETLKPEDEGVCVVKISVRKTRAKMVTSNKWCGKKKCVIRKTESYTVPEERAVCCNGWEYDVNTDSCGPICSTGCVGGRCVSPEVCHCDPPTILDPNHKNTCLQPKCDPPCVNAQCGIDNTCDCLPNYTRFNNTYCFKCDPGYEIKEDLYCTPICEEQCVNSNCTAPNTCSCLDGYEKVNSSACEPMCDICLNSTCVGPNICSCLEGYVKHNETTCVPKCENCTGICVAPNECTRMCPDGFVNVNDECKPDCGKLCENGVCVSPGECSCNEGFVKNESDSTTCVKVTHCDRPTVEEVSVPKTTYLKLSIKSKCPKGTTECSWKEKKEQHVNVKSTRCCKKSFTGREKRISCCSGWVWTGKVDDKCIPKCRSGCENGRCVAPDVCECNPPLILDENKCIEPKCDLCVNAKCVNHNTCACNPGHHSFNSTHCAIDCPVGYKNDNITLDCTPVCDSPCLNATCTGPNVCTCNSGHTHIDDFTCIPQCTPSCVNADCIVPNKCYCHENYTEKDGVCEPICEQPCSNGYCSAPNVCKCNDGFELDPKNKFDCLPICEAKCVNASCVSPNTCSCHFGYEFAGNNWTCKPKCSGCENGECIEPNVCVCHEGYSKKYGLTHMYDFICVPQCTPSCLNADCIAPNKCYCHENYIEKNGVCEPVCEQTCINGFCSAPNICKCNDGFKLNPKNTFDCLPVCETKCINASCVSPNTCSCHFGYEISGNNWTCKPKCSNCENGECIEPNVCKCHEGYSIKKGKCTPICETPCANGTCSQPNTCTCNKGYSLVGDDKFSCLPICEQRCMNATCTSPNTCSCWPGYEPSEDSNVCKPKCSSCLHGECEAPNTCVCNEGYSMVDGLCLPICSVACINANCTAPDTCTCIDGYENMSPSVCHKPCLNSCDHGVCSLNGICRCDPGYQMLNDTCSEIPPVDCAICEGKCSMEKCRCPDGRPCVEISDVEAEESNTGLAGMQLTATVAGAVVLLLLTLLVVVMHRLYRKRKEMSIKEVDDGNRYGIGSVVYTVPDTLIQRTDINDIREDDENDDEDQKTDRLLAPEFDIKEEKV